MSTQDITIVDHQADFLIVNKPQGMSFHDEEEIGSGFFFNNKSAS